MANQAIAKALGLIKDLKIFLHGIPYTFTFTVIHSSVLDSNYSMLLSCPWLKDAKVSHDWANNIITLQGTNLIRIILVTKKLRVPTKSLEKLVCYDFHFGIFDEENLMFVIEPIFFFNRKHSCTLTNQVRPNYFFYSINKYWVS